MKKDSKTLSFFIHVRFSTGYVIDMAIRYFAGQRLQDTVGAITLDRHSDIPDCRAQMRRKKCLRGIRQQFFRNVATPARTNPVFHFEYIRRISGKLSIVKRFNDGHLIHDRSTTDIHQICPTLHFGQYLVVEQMTCFRSQRQ